MPPVQPPLEMVFQLATTHVLQVRTVQLSLGTVLGTTHIDPTHLTWVRGWVETKYFGVMRTMYKWELRWLSWPRYN